MKKILYEKAGEVVTITINRPESLNAVDLEAYQEFSNALIEFRDDDEALVAIVTGSGEKSFSAGFDLTTLDATKPFPVGLGPTIMRGLDLWKPVIAAVNGMALGGGLEILAACDLAIACEEAVFGTPEVAWGLIPGWGGTQRLPRTIPKKKAAELLIMGTSIDASEAYRIGLVNKVVPRAELMNTAMQWATTICKKGSHAVQAVKEAMNRGLDTTLEEGLELEIQLEQKLWETDDAKEGFQAFIEKRKPRYNRGVKK
ncbi:enoyl-CoA hydratase/isomerase family protein [Chloroflexota bacterium]